MTKIQSIDVLTALLIDLPAFTRKQVLESASFRGVDLKNIEPYPFLIKILRAGRGKHQSDPAIAALLDHKALAKIVVNPHMLTLEQAIDLCKMALALEPQFDLHLVNYVAGPQRVWPEEITEQEAVRLLALLDAVSDCARFPFVLARFFKLSDKRIRSKAARLLARGARTAGWIKLALGDTDDRVRANVIEELAGTSLSPRETRELLRAASFDSHHRVATTALLYLARMDDPGAKDKLVEFSLDSRPRFQMAALWALKQLETPVQAPELDSPTADAPTPA